MLDDSKLKVVNPYWPEKWARAYIDTIQMIGKKAADLGAGEGLIFNSEDKKIQEFWDIWTEKQNLAIKIWRYFYQNSVIGRAHMLLSRNEMGELDLILLEIISNVRVSTVNEKEVAAQVFTAENSGDKGHYYQYDFYSKYLKVTKWITDDKTIIGSVITEIPKHARKAAEMVYETNIEIVPIIETTNLPKPRLYAWNTFTFHPDWEPIRGVLLDLQDIIKQKSKERKKNQTWLNGVLTPELQERLVNDYQSDFVKMIQDGLIQSNVNAYTKGNSASMEISYGDPPMANYNDDWLFTEIQIFNSCGYNHPREAENQSYTNKAQTLINGVLDEQTTRVKQQYYKTKLLRLFDYVLVDAGLWDGKGNRPYDFDYKSIGLADILQKDALINSRLLNGTISKVKAIQLYDNLTEAQAYKALETIEQENEIFGTYENVEIKEYRGKEAPEPKPVQDTGDLDKEVI